jgi:hypothetical protein
MRHALDIVGHQRIEKRPSLVAGNGNHCTI